MQKVYTVKQRTIGGATPLVCVPMVGSTKEELMEEAGIVLTIQPDLVEWRADYLHGVTDESFCLECLEAIHSVIGAYPLLFTLRIDAEGGQQTIDPDKRLHLIKKVIQSQKIDLVDIEYINGPAFVQQVAQLAKQHNVLLIVSNHDFEKTPPKEEIVQRLRNAQEAGADLPKIAVMPQSEQDVLELLSATNTFRTQHAKVPAITMSMAGMGVISRLTGGIFGSAITFGVLKTASAPGQISVKSLRSVLSLLQEQTK